MYNIYIYDLDFILRRWYSSTTRRITATPWRGLGSRSSTHQTGSPGRRSRSNLIGLVPKNLLQLFQCPLRRLTIVTKNLLLKWKDLEYSLKSKCLSWTYKSRKYLPTTWTLHLLYEFWRHKTHTFMIKS